MGVRRFFHGQQELAYRVDGEGPAIVLIHSYLASGVMWSKEIGVLKARYTVITVDLRGHGQSAPSHPHSLYDLVDDVVAVLVLVPALPLLIAVLFTYSSHRS